MTVLNVNGKRVQVDDGFKSLSPEDQAATVDEIAKSMGGRAEVEPAPATSEAPQVGQQQGGSLVDAGVTWLENSISGIPVAGPAIQKTSDFIGSNLQGLFTGEDPEAIRAGLAERRAQRDQAYPASAISGQIAGNIVAMGGIGATAAGAEALGITGAKLLPRVARSAGSNALISGADTAARGGEAADVINSAAIGGGIGGAIPAVGAGIRSGLGAIGERVSPTINAVLNPADEASRRVGVAVQRDRLAGDAVNQLDERVAKATGVDFLNVDRGGETTRALARSVANQNPEARQVLSNVASDRFASQGERANEVVRRIAGGSVDDIGYQEAIRTAARTANEPAYRAAYGMPEAQQVYSNRIQQLMQSPTFRRAVDMVPRKSADRGAISGAKEIGNPFTQNSQGQYVLRKKADGTFISPSLEFWDHVQRNLRSFSDKAARAGDNTAASEIGSLRRALNDDLDTAVPAFGSARKGAATFFDAEDSVEAGKKFATQPRMIPEARKAFEKFTDAEKAGFRTGYASELIDRIKSVGDRTNVINTVFKSQASRESMELVFGPQKLKALEAYIRVEDVADKLRGALGNSTTARQLVELGLGAGGGYALSGGDVSGAIIGGLAVRGGRALQTKAEGQVMQAVAKMLASSDPAIIEKAVKQAEKSPAFMKALDQLGTYLAAPSRGLSTSGAQ